MVPFDAVASGDCVISNSGGVTHLSKGFKMLDLSVMQSSLCFADIAGITVPATGFVDNIRLMMIDNISSEKLWPYFDLLALTYCYQYCSASYQYLALYF